MSERIKTEARTEEYLKARGLDPTEKSVWSEISAFADINTEVKPFTDLEAAQTAKKLESLKNKGLDGVAFVVQSSVLGSRFIMNSAPPELRRHITPIYFRLAGTQLEIDPEFADNLIDVDTQGNISEDDRKKLEDLLRNRIGIIAGGGPGYPTDPYRKPMLRAFEKAIRAGTPMVGICLGHQDLAHIAGYQQFAGMASLGPQIDIPTEKAIGHPVYSRLGMRMGSNAMNTAVILPGSGAQVLARRAGSGDPIAVEYESGLEYPRQAFSTLPHPEVSIAKGHPGEVFTAKKHTIQLDNEKVTIPVGTSLGMKKFVELASSLWENLKHMDMRPKDIQDIVHPGRLYPELGRDFVGPALDWMAETTSRNMDKRK